MIYNFVWCSLKLIIYYVLTHRGFNVEAYSNEVSKAFTSLEVDLSCFWAANSKSLGSSAIKLIKSTTIGANCKYKNVSISRKQFKLTGNKLPIFHLVLHPNNHQQCLQCS